MKSIISHQIYGKIWENMKRIEKGIYERGPCSFQVKMMVDGFSLSGTFDTLVEARAFRDLKRADVALDPDAKRVLESRVKRSEIKALTLSKALDNYEMEVTPSKKGADVEKGYIRKIKRHSIAKKSIYRITPEDLIGFLADLKRETKGKMNGQPLTGESKRKYASLISDLYEIARKRWRLAVANPVKDIELPLPCKSRKRRLEGDEESRLIEALKTSRNKLMLPLVQLAVETAMRQGELLKMSWEDLRLDENHGTAQLRDTKNGEDRVVPLSSRAVAVLAGLPRPIKGGKIFPMTKNSVRTAWDYACKRAKINDLRFHDLRHEATSRLFELGLDRIEAASVTGHKTLQMLKDYTHLRASKLAQKLNERQSTS
ncbi:MAG: site-specific integrase [Dechloromonas sp.]|nr:site-specific integrase [Dechloromonas sp.]